MAHGFNDRTFFHLLSFFGHYGVPIFLFLSAYGLVAKYENAKPLSPSQNTNTIHEPNTFRFLCYHWLKLFRMMIVGFSAFVLVDAITEGQHHYDVMDIVAQMGICSITFCPILMILYGLVLIGFWFNAPIIHDLPLVFIQKKGGHGL